MKVSSLYVIIRGQKVEVCRVSDAAQILGIQRQSVYDAIERKSIGSFEWNGEIFLPVDDVKEVLRRKQGKAS